MDLQGLEMSFFHGWNGRHVWLFTLAPYQSTHKVQTCFSDFQTAATPVTIIPGFFNCTVHAVSCAALSGTATPR